MGTKRDILCLIMMKKNCSMCGDEKVMADFHKDAKRKDGHTGLCKPCARAKARAWAGENPEKKKEQDAAYYIANRKKSLAQSMAWARAHPEVVRAKNSAWAKANLAIVNAKTARHRARRFCATPAWANEFFIEEAYDLAQRRTKATGFEWNVDHIVPLNSKKVCGLHVENNLRVIPKKANQVKSNRHWPDMPGSENAEQQ